MAGAYVFSEKQQLACRWWIMDEYKNYDAVICDGAVRSGKTFSMSIGFISWAMTCFNNCNFAICGKTIRSLKRNVLDDLINKFRGLGFLCIEKVTGNYIDIKMKGIKNRFYLFGGKDEGSASLIQGLTIAGVFFDEAALMPQSFFEQAIARCSVSDSKIWINCNPQNPCHWLYREWIKNSESKNALYIHFTMDDNPSLSEKIKQRYEMLFKGVFYKRYVKGIWTAAEGQIYSVFSEEKYVIPKNLMPESYEKYVISCDYGTVNPFSMGLWGKNSGKWYRISEYYFDSKKEGNSRTDEEHYKALCELAGNRNIEMIICDPSAASFIECVRRKGVFKVIPAKNDVLTGIRRVSSFIQQGKLLFSSECKDIIREFSLYAWDESKNDTPLKKNDHAMDDMRYFVNSYLAFEENEDSFFVGSVGRR